MSAIQKKKRKPPPRQPDPEECVAKAYFTDEEYVERVRNMPICKLVGTLIGEVPEAVLESNLRALAAGAALPYASTNAQRQ